MDLYNKATKYLDKNRPDKAIPLFKRQLKECEFKELWLNLGNCYRMQNKDALALDAYMKANDPTTPSSDGKFGEYDLALNNLGLLAFKLGDNDVAIENYKKCLAKNPLHYDAIWNYAIALLRKGCSGEDIDWAYAWKLYAYRFKKKTAVPLTPGLRMWDGHSKVDRIVVMAEQGQGDKIMFGRYVHKLLDYCDEVVVECPPGMEVLFNSDRIIGHTNRWEHGGVGVPICSLHERFGHVEAEWLRGKFTARNLGDGFKIGVVWSGSSTHANNANRSCTPNYFKDLSKFGKLYSLNPDARDIVGIQKYTGSNWADTASLVLGLDLVITVDTSIVHLCGSLGVPCWMIQPLWETDFRWGLGRSDSIWYKSVRVIENRGWDKTFKLIEADLIEYKAGIACKEDQAMIDYLGGIAIEGSDTKITGSTMCDNLESKVYVQNS